MRNFFLSLFFLIVFLGAGFLVYDTYRQGQEPFSEETVPQYPIAMTVESLDGRKVEVEILARTPSRIEFDRQTDGKFFSYPIEMLAPKTRKVVESLPVVASVTQSAYKPDPKLENIYVKELNKRLKEISDEINELVARGSASVSKTERRTLKNEIVDLEKEAKRIQGLIADRG